MLQKCFKTILQQVQFLYLSYLSTRNRVHVKNLWLSDHYRDFLRLNKLEIQEESQAKEGKAAIRTALIPSLIAQSTYVSVQLVPFLWLCAESCQNLQIPRLWLKEHAFSLITCWEPYIAKTSRTALTKSWRQRSAVYCADNIHCWLVDWTDKLTQFGFSVWIVLFPSVEKTGSQWLECENHLNIISV